MSDNYQTRRRILQLLGAATVSGIAAGSVTGDESDSTDYAVEELDAGLDNAWGIAFLPNDQILVTERGGTLNRIDRDDGTVEQIDGTPEVFADGQGGLLDVALYPTPDAPADAPAWVYLTYAGATDDGEPATHLGLGRLDSGDTQLEEFDELLVADPSIDSDGHFGSRAVFGGDGMLYMTTGDRQQKDFGEDHVSQDTTNELGATLRLAPDGSIPDDNPFVDESGVADAIFSYGHRNVQAMARNPETGEIWQVDHGEEDGDEINIVEEGGNYGWPIAHTGCEYGTDEPVGDDPFERDDVVNPVYYWECGSGGFPPSGATFYDGEAFPDWQGDLFVGNLAGQYLGRFTVDEEDVEEIDPLLVDEGWRIRDVAVAPDTGHLYALLDEEDAPIVRLVPEENEGSR